MNFDPSSVAESIRGGIHPLSLALKGFCVDWIAAANPNAARQYLDAEYTAHVGGMSFPGLETYLPAVLSQLETYPGLCLTVHEVLLGYSGIAMVFSEHGATAEGSAASWRGIGLFSGRDGQLTENWTEEDYLSRHRQLKSGSFDAIPSPAVAPWHEALGDVNISAEEVVQGWLMTGCNLQSGITIDDDSKFEALLEVEKLTVNHVISSGDRVAMHATIDGHFLGGLGLSLDFKGTQASMGVAAILHVSGKSITGGTIVRDRAGLRRRLMETQNVEVL